MTDFIEVPASKISISKRKLVYGIGINDADYNIQSKISGKNVRCPYYRKWTNMLNRCYSDKPHDKYPTYIGCTVCDEWLTFSNFKEWMIKQDWKGMHLDKDIKINGNKTYSPETCVFIPHEINSLMLDCAASRGALPLGVSYHRNGSSVMARVRTIHGVKTKTYPSMDRAIEWYKKKKKENILEISELPEYLPWKKLIINLA